MSERNDRNEENHPAYQTGIDAAFCGDSESYHRLINPGSADALVSSPLSPPDEWKV